MKRLLKAIAIVVVVSAASGLLRAADPVHHFVLTKPAKVIAGDSAVLVVSAHRKDKTLIGDATNKIMLSVTTREGTEKHELQLIGGKASINIKFAKYGSHLIWVQDESNPDLNLSDSVKVDYKVEVLR
jgi:hypothetical protein